MKYELVLIDLDDTLFDYSKTEDSAFRKTFEKMGFFQVNQIEKEKIEENYEKIRKRYKEINLQLWKDLEKGKMDKDKLKVLRFEKIIEEFGLEYDSIEVSELYLKNWEKESFHLRRLKNCVNIYILNIKLELLQMV